jgi:hypothetical protein
MHSIAILLSININGGDSISKAMTIKKSFVKAISRSSGKHSKSRVSSWKGAKLNSVPYYSYSGTRSHMCIYSRSQSRQLN